MNMIRDNLNWMNEIPLTKVRVDDFTPPHYQWTRTGPNTLVISVMDDQHRTSWTVSPDINGLWTIDDTQGVPLALLSTNFTRQEYEDPGRAIDAAQNFADALLTIWDQEIEGRIVEKRAELLSTELAFRGIPIEIQESPRPL